MIRDQKNTKKRTHVHLTITFSDWDIPVLLFKMGRVTSLELYKFTLGLFQTCKETEAVIFEQKVMKRR